VTKASIESLAATYRNLLNNAGVLPQQVDPTQILSREEILGHCLWVLEYKIGPLLNRVGGFQEAVRLLGCIQGTVMALGLCTIADTRDHANEAGMTTWDKIVG
jgi:hypothetical protein